MKSRWFALAIAAALVRLVGATPHDGAAPGPGESFTLEQVLSAPFPSDLVAAPKGRAVAWVSDDQGKRNIWIADGAMLRGRQLTTYLKDDGQEITDVTWTPDVRAIVYVRGGEKSEKGEVPNPTSQIAGVEQEVWIAPIEAGQPRKLGAGHSPAVSPRGDRVAFIYDDQVWIAPLTSTSPAERFFTIRGKASSLTWSPDGTMVAFVTNRTDHSFIGLFQPDRPNIEYLSPSFDRDVAPRWSPDGRQIAFVRIKGIEAPPQAAANPWSIMVAGREPAGAKFGAAREAWRAPEVPGGSLPRVVSSPIVEWIDGNRLLFASEHDRWAHLYSIDAGSTLTAASLLTPGECEVEDVAVAKNRREVFFSSNCDDIDRRHIWRATVGASVAKPQRMTSDGIEMTPAPLADGQTLAFIKADARQPQAVYALSLKDSTQTPVVPNAVPVSFPASQLVEPKQAIFKSADGWEIHGQIFEPRARGAGRVPAIIFMHGGPPRQMLLGWHYMYYYHNAYALNQYLAARGYLVLSVNYRSGIGYGRLFREAPDRGAMGASEYQDIVAAAQYLRGRPDVDSARIGLWGGSYGGYLTALGLARNSDLFAAGVDIHGVHDWSVFRRFNLGPAGSAESVRVARESSPIASVDTWRSPVLFIHGDDDRNVDFNQSVELIKALRKRNVSFEQLVFPDEIHDFLLHADWLRAYHAAVEFFNRKLTGGPITSSMAR
jgi:dipeptidyl aminopeptidase/acylaminoacyl peptidase